MQLRARLAGALILCIGAVATWTAAGCNRPPARPPENKAANDLRKIIQAYDAVVMTSRRGPRDMEEIKPHLQKLLADEDPEPFLRSPNDGQPYEVIFGINLDRGEEDPGNVIAYEKTGAQGKRFVITIGRITREMTDAEFADAKFAKGARPGKKK